MPDLLRATAVEPGDTAGTWRATLSPDWAVWGPNGGYLAALALRAALSASRFDRVASFHCHFLAVGEFAPVALEVTTLGGGRRAESLRVDVRQGERLLLAATAWLVADGIEGFAHEAAEMPDVPAPHALKSYRDLAGDEYDQWYPIWRSIEGRPVRWREAPGAPRWHTWLRLTETVIPDRAADALRQLFWLDMPGWNATIAAHAWPFPYLAPNLDLTVQFHRFAPATDWMLAEGHAPLAGEGLVGCTSRLWSEDGTLLATGTSKHVFRRNPGYEDECRRARELGLLPEAPAEPGPASD